MFRIDQTELGEVEGGIGDCWSAALASILELQTGVVPHFARIHGNYHMKDQAALWLRSEHGVGLISCGPFTELYRVVPAALAIGSGMSPRDPKKLHSIVVSVYRPQEKDIDVALVHDPHPSRLGIVGPIKYLDFLVKGCL